MTSSQWRSFKAGFIEGWMTAARLFLLHALILLLALGPGFAIATATAAALPSSEHLAIQTPKE